MILHVDPQEPGLKTAMKMPVLAEPLRRFGQLLPGDEPLCKGGVRALRA